MQISEPAEYAILGLLARRPMHGYEMFQQFEHGLPGQIVHLEMSQMYAFLKKLERLQYIKAELEVQGTRPPRKVFHLTDTGHQVLFEWLVEPVTRPREVRILFLMKLYFLQHFLPHRMPDLITRQIAACQSFLAHLESSQQEDITPAEEQQFFEQVVLPGRIHQTRALLDWLHELQQQITRDT